jgi:NAD(P)-dependent dehydrogenase (short-subunit alcohol dehydrogenase family)
MSRGCRRRDFGRIVEKGNDMGLLKDKVVLVTGAGGGIGRECALLIAREGAKVVVNDLGTSIQGKDDGTPNTAAATVAEIRAAGGEAIANSESIASMAAAERMVEQALAEFGRLDAVVNPAGILRDGMFHKMSEDAWDAVIEVHLRGAFNVSRAAVGQFREQGSGTFVHFTSTTGLIGNIAQANYGAAKMGVVGLSRILAMEGAIKGVRSNVIAPFAWTRMVATIPVTDEASAQRVERFRTGMRADQIAPLAAALIADGASDVSGQVFAVRGNEVILFSQPRPIASIAQTDGWSAAALVEKAFPAFQPKFTDLGASASVFPYDPL